jgi:hypothetical protein
MRIDHASWVAMGRPAVTLFDEVDEYPITGCDTPIGMDTVRIGRVGIEGISDGAPGGGEARG